MCRCTYRAPKPHSGGGRTVYIASLSTTPCYVQRPYNKMSTNHITDKQTCRCTYRTYRQTSNTRADKQHRQTDRQADRGLSKHTCIQIEFFDLVIIHFRQIQYSPLLINYAACVTSKKSRMIYTNLQNN